MKLAEIKLFLSPISVLLPIIAMVYVRKAIDTRRFQITSIFFIICLMSEIFSLIFASIYKNNLIILNIFTGLEFIFWCYFFITMFESKLLRIFLLLLIIPVFLIWLNHAYFFSLWQFNSLFATCESSVILLLAALFLLMLSKKSSTPIQEVPEFWFASGAMIYFTHSIITLGVSWFIRETQPSAAINALNNNFLNIYIIFNILANIIYSKGFLCLSTKKI